MTDELVNGVKTMLAYRGFKEVTEVRRLQQSHAVILGRNQIQPNHPRPTANCLALIDAGESTAATGITGSLRALYDLGREYRLETISSLLYIYQASPKTGLNQTIEKSYVNILRDLPIEQPRPFLEYMSAGLFEIDWKTSRTSKDWHIEKPELFTLIEAADGSGSENSKPILVDRPPMLSFDDPVVQYIGGRPNDYISYLRLENIQVGPMWLYAMAKVSGRGSTVSSSEISQEEADARDAAAGLEDEDDEAAESAAAGVEGEKETADEEGEPEVGFDEGEDV
jgi:hypothetical protein